MSTRRDVLAAVGGLGLSSGIVSAEPTWPVSSRNYPRIGVYSSVSSARMADYGAEAMAFHRRGIRSIYVDEDRDALISAAAIISGSRDIEIGTAWCSPGRSPVLLATAARWLLALSGGRFTLGIGLNSPALASPLGFAWKDRHDFLADYLAALRRLADTRPDTPLRYDGAYFKFSRPGARTVGEAMPHPPILLKLTDVEQFRVAGSTCDGVVLGQMTPLEAYEQIGRVQFRSGAQEAGRSSRPIRVDKMVWTLVSDDSKTAIERMRGLIASKMADESFGNRELAAAAGFAWEADEIASRFAAGDKKGAAQAVSEEMWRAYGLAGTAAEVRAQASKYGGKVDTLICMGSMFGLPDFDSYVREHLRAIDAVAPS